MSSTIRIGILFISNGLSYFIELTFSDFLIDALKSSTSRFEFLFMRLMIFFAIRIPLSDIPKKIIFFSSLLLSRICKLILSIFFYIKIVNIIFSSIFS